MSQYIRWFKDLTIDDVPLVGGKNASLGEMYRELTSLGVLVPNGFAITVKGYEAMLSDEHRAQLKTLLSPLGDSKHRDLDQLANAGQQARDLVYSAPLPADVKEEILGSFRQLKEEYGESISVAVRSSATAEDLPQSSFAGQHDTFLNVRGEAGLLDAVKRCFASLFTNRAIAYRIDNNYPHEQVLMSVGIMKMVRSDLGASGVMFSIDSETGFRDVVFITSAYGLGETVVQGAVEVDEAFVHKPTFNKGARAVLRRRLGAKEVMMTYSSGRTREPVKIVKTPLEKRKKFCLSDEEILKLASYAIKIENHYSANNGGMSRPMDIEWCRDGLDNQLYVVQARPETVAVNVKKNQLTRYMLEHKPDEKVLVTGRALGTMTSTGKVRVIKSLAEMKDFHAGEILVANNTTPDYEPIMKKSAGVITSTGGRTCHAAIVARELGKPAIVGCGDLEVLKTGMEITLCCSEGDIGKVYEGTLAFEVQTTNLEDLRMPQTNMMINLANPAKAFELSFMPCDGVGLARLEFIISEYIKAHPMALLHPEKVSSSAGRTAIAKMTANHKDGADFFVRELSEGVGTLAAAFYPRPVIVRLSDFKTNEYSGLLGGEAFEENEENPMIGFRGASRYTHESFAECFALECKAMLRVREEMGLTNLKIMVPFCRTLGEADSVLETMARHGLKRGENGLEIYVMCEIPNNVILIDEFAKRFDGFSIGSNDLTQLTLGVDRDNAKVAPIFDERDPGVKAMLKLAVEGAKRNQRHSGICGQAPSDYPEIAEFLVGLGIESISLTPDSLLKTIIAVRNLEDKLGIPERSTTE